MIEVSVYDCGRRRSQNRFAGSKVYYGLSQLTPRVAKSILAMLDITGGMVYQDNVVVDGQRGTLAYRVYPAGGTRRYFWEYDHPAPTMEHPAQNIEPDLPF